MILSVEFIIFSIDYHPSPHIPGLTRWISHRRSDGLKKDATDATDATDGKIKIDHSRFRRGS